jgi:tetratricopeptide (TPR) repeat protein
MQSLGLLSQTWQARIRQAEGECYRLAGESALREKHFEEGLESLLRSARLLDRDEGECRARAVEEILSEIRRLFASTPAFISKRDFGDLGRNPGKSEAPKDESISKLVQLVKQIQSPCAEVSFWQGLGYVREGSIDLALASLEESRSVNGRQIFDPSFYLGILLIREGRIAEALRHLADAYRMAPECPLVTWQMGMAMVADGGKDNLAVRPLQKALSPQGLAAWIKSPRRLWQQALPDREHCYVRRLTEELLFVCPVLGTDVAAMVRQGQAALAQAQYRLGNFAEAAELYEAVFRDSPPSLPILRGLGLSLARLEQYDEAFKHLRAAFDLEQRRDVKGNGAWTAGYLALCGAKGRPNQPEDKSKNILWAIRTLAGFDIQGDPEWARIYNEVFAEARVVGMQIPAGDQVRSCDVLASVNATDSLAGAAYYNLWATRQDALRVEHAWLYCRAVEQHRLENTNDLEIFRRAFADDSVVRVFYAERGWNLEEAEFLFMTRCASAEKTSLEAAAILPDPLRQKAETFLLDRSERLEQANQGAEALACVDVLLRLAPQSWPAHDRLARLRYRAGDLNAASEILALWHVSHPDHYFPLIRKAVIDQQRGRPDDCLQSIHQALELTSGRLHGSIALLGGRLALLAGRLQSALELFLVCLREFPEEPTALWCSAAVRYLLGDRAGLASQTTQMNRPEVTDPRFHYMAAVAHLTAGEYDQTIEAGHRAAVCPPWTLTTGEGECAYLDALVHLHRNDLAAASVELQRIVESTNPSPSVDHARAHLARIRFSRGSLEEAIRLWREMDDTHRHNWQIDEVVQRTTFLAGLQLLKAGQYDRATGFLRDLSRSKGDDPGLSALLTHALVEAGRSCLSQSDYTSAAHFLEEAISRGNPDSKAVFDLALVYKHFGNISESRRVLQNYAYSDSGKFFQLGLLSLAENRLAQAEKEFGQAWSENPTLYQAGYNLVLIRLSLGEVGAALDLLPNLTNLAVDDEDRSFLALLDKILRICPSQNGPAAESAAMPDINAVEEQKILELCRQLGHPPTAERMLGSLAMLRREDASLRAGTLETVLVQAKQLLDRCNWTEASQLLSPWAEVKEAVSRPMRAALLNLLGCCACLNQEFESGIHFFTGALQLVNRDARLSQNLALAYELQGRLSEAEPHWNWYLEMLDSRIPASPDYPGYKNRLAFECLHRLAVRFSDKGNAKSALTFLQRAHHLRPEDTDTLERLFHIFNQLKRPEDARRALRRLQHLRPQDPQMEMFELELIEVNNLDNCNRVLAGIEALQRKYPDDARVAERQAQMIGGIVSYMKRLSRQISEQLERAAGQIRRLPSYQVDWPEMRHYLRDLRSRMQRIKKTALRERFAGGHTVSPQG